MPEIIVKPKEPLEQVRDVMERAMKARDKHLEDWRNDFRLYKSYIDMSNRDKRRSNAFIPLVFPLIENAAARYIVGLMGVDPIVSVLPREQGDYSGAQAMELALQYYLERAGIFMPMNEVAKLMLMFGDGFIVERWRTEIRNKTVEEPIEELGFTVGYEEVERPEIIYDGVWFDVYAPYQVFHDGGDTVDQCKVVVVEDFWHIDDLRALEKRGLVHDIDDIPLGDRELMAGGSEMDKWSLYKDCGYSSPEDDEGMVRVWRAFWDDHWYWIAQAHTEIFDHDNPHSHGRKPLVQFPKTKQPKHFFSISATRPAARLQHAYNTLFDQVMDRNAQTINPWVLLKRTSGINPNRLISTPNNIIETNGEPSTDIYVHTVPALTGDAGAMMDQIKSAFDEVTGYFGYQKGFEQTTRTAKEATILAQAGDMRIRYDLMQYESYGMRPLAERVGSDIQDWMPGEIQARLAGSNGFRFQRLSRDELRGSYDYRFLGSTAAYNREIDRAQLLEMLNLVANFPEINRGGLLDTLIDAVPSLRASKQKILRPPPGPMMGLPGMQQPQAMMGQPARQPGRQPGGQRRAAGPVRSVGQTAAVTNPNTFAPTTGFDQLMRPPRYRAVA